jgi:hypothetical protein
MTDADILLYEASELRQLALYLDDELVSGGSTKAALHVAISQARLSSARLDAAGRAPAVLVPADLPELDAVAELARWRLTMSYPTLPVAHHAQRRRTIGQIWVAVLCGALVVLAVFAAGSMSAKHGNAPMSPAVMLSPTARTLPPPVIVTKHRDRKS